MSVLDNTVNKLKLIKVDDDMICLKYNVKIFVILRTDKIK